jgi:GNAT superfamily N-acetyltransferase
MQPISIRKGIKSDLPQVLQLIQELAIYEKAAGEVIITVEALEKDGFGNHPLFHFFVAELDNKVVGLALYYIKYSTWKGKCVFLEDLIVNSEYRKHGIGKKLFNEVIKAAKEIHAERMEWQVLDWNEPAINFYKTYDTHFAPEWVNCKLVGEQIQNYQF